MTDIFSLPVLPAADVFPMLPEDELAELADDIKENGLRESIVICEAQTADGEVVEMIVDGRNRRAACKLAGVEPTVRRLNGEDPNAYVLSANIHRRHMTKGQRAMAVAMIYPEAKKYRRGGNPLEIKGLATSDALLSQARTVLKYSRPLADEVLSGITALNDAYEKAQQAKAEHLGNEASGDRLRKEAPDLHDLVNEGRMNLAEAMAAAHERRRERERVIEQAREANDRIWHDLAANLGAIVRGEELGASFDLSPDKADFVRSVVDNVTALSRRRLKL